MVKNFIKVVSNPALFSPTVYQITSHQTETLLAVKQRRARIILGEMVDQGVLDRHGSYKNTVYVLKEGR